MEEEMEISIFPRSPVAVTNKKIVICNSAFLVVTLCVLSFVGSALAQSDSVDTTAKQAATPQETPENAGMAQAQTDTNSAQQGQRPTLSSDEIAVPGKPSIAPTEHTRLTFRDRWTLYHRSIFTPEILAGPAFGAGLGQLRNDPGEWREGIAGYGRRFGSGLARSVISRTVSFSVAAADGEDPRSIRSEESGMWARTRHAVVWTFITRNQNGSRMPAYSRFVGTYGAAFAANRWYPSSENNTNHALKMGSTAIASSVGFHILNEFWPDIMKVFHRKGSQSD